jgi:hypothetical protein
MTIINFTESAPAISDFHAENVVRNIICSIEKYDIEKVNLCNVLLWNMLRAELINSPLKTKVVWQFEGETIDMDANMNSNAFWRHSVTELQDKALEKLLEG